jgi:hypothetical protein
MKPVSGCAAADHPIGSEEVVTRNMEPGDLGPHMIVWPVARTMTAPSICYTQPRCRVVAVHWPYAIITPQPRRGATNGGPRYRVHVDNLQRTDPAHRRTSRLTPIRNPPRCTGWTQLPLFPNPERTNRSYMPPRIR